MIRLKYDGEARTRDLAARLVGVFEGDDASASTLAAVQLSRMGPSIVPYLVATLKDALNRDRRNLVRGLVTTLGIFAVEDTAPLIARALPDEAAFEALSKIGTKEALGFVMRDLPAWLRWRDFNQESSLDENILRVRSCFEYFGDAGLKALEGALSSPDLARRDSAAALLAAKFDARSFGVLSKSFRVLPTGTKALVLDLLAKSETTAAVPLLRKELASQLKTYEPGGPEHGPVLHQRT